MIPSAVNGDKDALTKDGKIQPQTLNPIPVISVLTKATQELARKVKAQETQLTAQESELTELRAELAKLRGERKTLAQIISDMEGRFTRLEKAVHTPATRTVSNVNASAEVK